MRAQTGCPGHAFAVCCVRLKRKTIVVVVLAAGAMGLAGVVGIVIAGASTFGGQAVTRASCRPRNLTRVDACWGWDDSFQECHFYYGATGVPDPAFCKGLVSDHDRSSESHDCTLDLPFGWAEVDCKKYSLDEWARCFACNVREPEAGRTYIYGYNEACSAAIEQVTCNFDARRAGEILRVHP